MVRFPDAFRKNPIELFRITNRESRSFYDERVVAVNLT